MKITKADDADFDALVRIWEAAVRATHHFLSEEDIVHFRKQLRDVYLGQVELHLAVEDDAVIGFMGLIPPEERTSRPAKVAMLFIEPAYHVRGAGRALIRRAADKYGALDVDVNEQNPGAVLFYERCGFVRTGRSETDDEGNPFPLLHLHREGE